MTGQELGQKFFTYLAEKTPSQAQPGEAYAYLYGSDEFVVDHERSVLIFPEVGEVGFEKDEDSDAFPEWMAAVVHANGEQEIVAGYCEPFGEEALALLPNVSGSIRAMPYWIKKRMGEPRIQKLLSKSKTGSKGWLNRGS
jgi:hypothetical protein